METPGRTRTVANLPAVVGVIVVAMAVLVAWVVTSNMGSDQVAIDGGTTPVSTSTSQPATTPVPTTAPKVITVPITVEPTEAPDVKRPPLVTTTQPPPRVATPNPTKLATTTSTTAALTNADSGTGGTIQQDGATSGGEGDLGIAEHPIQQPTCDGAYVTIVASAAGSDVSAAGLALLLNQYAGSQYLRTDLSCQSFSRPDDGSKLYVVYFGPFAYSDDACRARAEGPAGAYVKRLVDDGDTNNFTCG